MLAAAVTTALGVGLFLVGGLALAPWQVSPGGQASPSLDQAGAAPGGDPLSAAITTLQAQLRQTPQDPQALATLGLEYVQQAKNTADPSYYPKAEAVLERSLALQKTDNFTAQGGMAALENARHHFTAALGWARQAVAVNPYNSTLYGTLADAFTQLGRYDQAADAVQRMVDLKPGAPSLARASYVAELRGDIATARHDMQRALQDSASPTDEAFAYYYLGQLAFNNGDPKAALAQARQGLAVAPTYTPLLQAKAQAEAALGQTDAAIADLTQATARVPQPEYVLELGELDQSLGRTAQATEQYQLFRAEQQLFTDNGVTPDSDAALFEADHGNPQTALAIARAGIRTRPFLETHDALAWALHLNNLDHQALAESDQALAQGTRNALFHYHRALIQLALGDTTSARAELTTTLAINPHFNPLDAPRAHSLLSDPHPKSR